MNKVTPITTDPIVRARAILAVGREEFEAALRCLEELEARHRAPSDVTPLFDPDAMRLARFDAASERFTAGLRERRRLKPAADVVELDPVTMQLASCDAMLADLEARIAEDDARKRTESPRETIEMRLARLEARVRDLEALSARGPRE